MNKEFVPYEQALALKELGFDEQCLALYDLDGKITIEFVNWKNAKNRKSNYLIATPLYQQAFRGFREKYKLDPTIKSWTENNKIIYYISTEPIGKPSRYKCYEVKKDSYEEAELECLKKLIEIVKNK